MRRLTGLGVVVALLLSGCAEWDTGSVARTRAAEELECREDDTEIEQLGAHRYRGEGCGRVVTLACSASRLEPVCLRQSGTVTAGGVGDPAPPGAEPPPEEEGGPPPFDEEPPPEIEARIREGLGARRDDILACTGRERVGVRAAYGPDGEVTFQLQGELEGTPEERCVGDALDGVRVAATGHAGVVVHLVR